MADFEPYKDWQPGDDDEEDLRELVRQHTVKIDALQKILRESLDREEILAKCLMDVSANQKTIFDALFSYTKHTADAVVNLGKLFIGVAACSVPDAKPDPAKTDTA